MEELKLNQTPVRTSRNYNINNIKLKDITIPKEIGNFENLKLKGKTSLVKKASNLGDMELKYGVGIVNNSNIKLQINITECLEEPLELDFMLNEQNKNLVENIVVNASEGVQATVILKYETDKDIQGFHNGIIKVNANKDAKIDVVLINLVNSQTNNFLSIENVLEEQSNVKYTVVDFGGKNSITNYYSNIKGKKADSIINTIYLGRDNQLFDINYVGELWGEQSNLDIDVQGAIKDNARKHFKGTIDFKRGCKKATGNENEYCTILSDTAKSIALPMLLCEEEDVEGNHSTSAGKIGEKELFYIMSRGFELKEALKLMLRAKFNKVLENIHVEELKEQIISEMEARLD